MDTIFLESPISESEAVVRKLILPPDKRDFNTQPCLNNYVHTLCLDVDDVLASQTGSWTLICSHHSHANLVLDAAPRCEDCYRLRNLSNCTDSLSDTSRVPSQFAKTSTDMLTYIRKFLQQLIPGDLPDKPTELLNGNYHPLRPTSSILICSRTSDGVTCQDALDPDESMLKLVVPRTGRELIVVAFFRSETPRYVGRGWAPNTAAFKFSDYQFQHSAPTPLRRRNTRLRT
ncbi:hypothetical protein B0H14DRAFT_3483900 [Mycena olivaceomarginata]|nr:hypothetical protein B0H14DRAFT_3483900 [Mycena olivaceomarginata]